MPAPRDRLRAWRPGVSGITEVLHARFPTHRYPSHTHDTWTLLVLDAGVVRYDLDRRERGATRGRVHLLPPHVAHDGRSALSDGFAKRVLYLEATALDLDRVGAAVDHPGWVDPALLGELDALHRALDRPGETFEAEGRLAVVRHRLGRHLAGVDVDRPVRRDPPLVRRLRLLLDERVVDGVGLAEAGRLLGTHPTHLVRAFTAELGIPPHRYLTGRRVDRARRLLLDGRAPAEVAAMVGFWDQAHLTRHFRAVLGTTPAAYAAAGRAP